MTATHAIGEGGPSVIVRRGGFVEAHENTLAAVTAARTAGADGVSLDLTVTRDGTLVCFHDTPESRKRLHGSPTLRLSEQRWADVRAIRLKPRVTYPHHSFAYTAAGAIPRLEEVLDAHGDGLLFVLNVRTYAGGIPWSARPRVVNRLVELLDRKGLFGRTVLASFDPSILHALRGRSDGRATTAFRWDDSVPIVGAQLAQSAVRMMAEEEEATALGRAGRFFDRVKSSARLRKLLGSPTAASVELTALDVALVRRLKAQSTLVGTYTFFPVGT